MEAYNETAKQKMKSDKSSVLFYFWRIDTRFSDIEYEKVKSTNRVKEASGNCVNVYTHLNTQKIAGIADLAKEILSGLEAGTDNYKHFHYILPYKEDGLKPDLPQSIEHSQYENFVKFIKNVIEKLPE